MERAMNADCTNLTANFGSEIASEAERLFPGWERLSDLINASGVGQNEVAVLSGKMATVEGLKRDSLEPLISFLGAYATVWAVIGARAREHWVLPEVCVAKPN
jgi:hypothetical protein